MASAALRTEVEAARPDMDKDYGHLSVMEGGGKGPGGGVVSRQIGLCSVFFAVPTDSVKSSS